MYCADLMASPGETHTHQRRHGIAIAFDFVGWMQEYLFKEGRILSADATNHHYKRAWLFICWLDQSAT